MAGWLQKIFPPPTRVNPPKTPVTARSSQPLAERAPGPVMPPTSLPNATIIYGIGASLLFVSSFFLLIGGRWFAALAVFALGICLVGFAVHLLKHPD